MKDSFTIRKNSTASNWLQKWRNTSTKKVNIFSSKFLRLLFVFINQKVELHLEEFLNFILKKAVPRILLYLFLTSFAGCWRCSVEFAAKTAIELEANLNPDINHTSSWMQENKNEKSKDYCKADLKQRVLRKQAISENEQDGICYL